jgi:hypothetical protein
MALDMDPDHINDADRQLQVRIAETGTSYAAANAESKKLSEKRAKIRATIKEMGVRTDAYQTAIHIVKDLSPSEGKAFMADLELLVKVLGAKQSDLFPEEQVRALKREEKRTAAKNSTGVRTPEELDAATNGNPRSDPNAGGAKPELPPDPPPVDSEAEQAAGAAALAAAAPKMSQSQKAAQKRVAAKLDG